MLTAIQEKYDLIALADRNEMELGVIFASNDQINSMDAEFPTAGDFDGEVRTFKGYHHRLIDEENAMNTAVFAVCEGLQRNEATNDLGGLAALQVGYLYLDVKSPVVRGAKSTVINGVSSIHAFLGSYDVVVDRGVAFATRLMSRLSALLDDVTVELILSDEDRQKTLKVNASLGLMDLGDERG